MSGDGPDLTPDTQVTQLLAQTSDAPDVVRLVGFLGPTTDGYVRLYADPALMSWIELRVEDIVRRDRIESEEATIGGRSVLFVKGTAMRTPVQRPPDGSGEAEFLRASADVEALLPEVRLFDVAVDATFIDRFDPFARTFRTCKP